MDAKVALLSSDNEEFEVSRDVAGMMLTVENLLADTGDGAVVPLMNVSAKTLAKVIEFCKYRLDSDAADADCRDKEFVQVEKATLFELILAANYLNVKPLLDLTCQAVADLIKGKSPEEIRKEFGIENDFTPAEEEEVRRENQWAFD